MKTITYVLEERMTYPFPCKTEEILFFDIETTGLSADISFLYMIGALYYKEGQWQIIQWFAQDYESEILLLEAFFSFSRNFSLLIHYNGTRFDIPFLEKKCARHKLTGSSYSFSNLEQLDIYKRISTHKNNFTFQNLKQKTIEDFLRITRTDTYSGKQLIKVYHEYVHAQKTKQKDTATHLETLLLLHNYEDLLGMLKCCEVLFYTDLLEGLVPISQISFFKQEQYIELKANVTFTFKQVYSHKSAELEITLKNNEIFIKIPIVTEELKYFYPDYKNYFYLPKEDTAIHKCVATYVDKDYRIKATKENCYTRKQGTFIPNFSLTQFPCFRKDYTSNREYFLLNEEFYENKEYLMLYASSIFKTCKAPLFSPKEN